MVFYSTVVIFTSGPKQGGKDSNKLIMLQHSIHHIQSYTYSQLRWGSGYLYTYMVVSNMTFMFHNKKGMSFFPTDFHSIIFQRGGSTTNQYTWCYFFLHPFHHSNDGGSFGFPAPKGDFFGPTGPLWLIPSSPSAGLQFMPSWLLNRRSWHSWQLDSLEVD
jgi:hypothetical protein